MNTLKPSVKQIANTLSYLDFVMNCEIFLYDLQSVIFWASISEIALFLLGFILFCSAPSLMGYIWLHFFHCSRGFLGFYLINKLPASHQIVERI